MPNGIHGGVRGENFSLLLDSILNDFFLIRIVFLTLIFKNDFMEISSISMFVETIMIVHAYERTKDRKSRSFGNALYYIYSLT